MKKILLLISVIILFSCSSQKFYFESIRTQDYKPIVDSICKAYRLEVPADTSWTNMFFVSEGTIINMKYVLYELKRKKYLTIRIHDTDSIDVINIKVE